MTEEKSVVRGVYMRCLLLRGMSFNRVFVPPAKEAYAYDADGNQTLVTTGTGAWQVEYNGENRPVRWTCGDKTILMTFDHRGRRRLYVEVTAGVTNKLHRFTYDDYVCIARNRGVDVAMDTGGDAFVWDQTESIATRPLMCDLSGGGALLYCHDGNKNVSEAVTPDGTIAAHYEYSSFGKVVLVTSENEDQSTANRNPYRFSSEYADDALGLVYYNYRHYNPQDGRWMSRDYLDEDGINLFLGCNNNQIGNFDVLGAFDYFCVCSLTPPYVGTKMGAVKADDGMCGMHNVGTTSKIHVEPGSCNATFDYSWNACFCAKRQCEMRITYRCSLVKYSGGETYQWVVASVEVTSCHSSN